MDQQQKLQADLLAQYGLPEDFVNYTTAHPNRIKLLVDRVRQGRIDINNYWADVDKKSAILQEIYPEIFGNGGKINLKSRYYEPKKIGKLFLGSIELANLRSTENPYDEKSNFLKEPINLEIRGYSVEVRRPIEDAPIEKERLQVILTDPNNKDYYADFVSLRYIKGIMEQSKTTGELANGSYFPGQGRVILSNLTKPIIEKTLAEIIEQETFRFYFKRI